MKQRLSFALTLIVSALIIGFWGFHDPDSQPSQTQSSEDENSVDAFLSGIESVQYDQQGQPSHKIIADALTHYSLSEHSVMENPDMTFYRSAASPIRLTAKTAEANADQTEIWFRHDVFIDEQTQGGMTMATERLRLEPDNDFAETDLAVTLKAPSGTTHAIGMKAYLAEDRVELLKDVRSTYVQP